MHFDFRENSPMVEAANGLRHVFLLAPSFHSRGGFEVELMELAIGLQKSGVDVDVFIRDPVRADHPYWKRMRAAGTRLHAPPLWLNRILTPSATFRKAIHRLLWVLVFPIFKLWSLSNIVTRRISRQEEKEARRRIQSWLKKAIQGDASTWWMENSMDRIFHRRQPNLIDVQHSMLPSGIAYGHRRSLPTIYTEYGAPAEYLLSVWAGLGPVINQADFIIGRAHASIEGLRRICGMDRPCAVVVNAVSSAPYESTDCSLPTDSEAVIMAIGRHSPEKGLKILVEAFKQLIADGLSARLVLAGDGSQRTELESLVRQWHLEKQVRFVGLFEDLAPLIKKARIIAHPTFNDGRSIAVLEAMAWGRPVVASDTGGLPELIEHQVTGLLVSPGDVKALTSALMELVLDVEKCHRMGQAARKKFLEGGFTSENMIFQTKQIYSHVLQDDCLSG
jgi:glycosyltransferase involved in cell wall biosynthesis